MTPQRYFVALRLYVPAERGRTNYIRPRSAALFVSFIDAICMVCIDRIVPGMLETFNKQESRYCPNPKPEYDSSGG
jgi:hypothetical protein